MGEPGQSEHSFVFETDDLDEMQAFLAQVWANVELGADRPHPQTRVQRVGTDGLSIDDVRFDYDLRFESEPPPQLCVCFLRSGHVHHRPSQGGEHRHGPGEVYAIPASELSFQGEFYGIEQIATIVDPTLLSAVAEAAPPFAPADVRVIGRLPVSPTASRQLLMVINHLQASVLGDPAMSRWPLVTGAAKRLLATSILEAFPSNATRDPRVREIFDAHPAMLRRAIAYIEESAAADITVADIAAAAHVSIRSVQFAFRRHLDTTPMAYLKRVRLSAANEHLHVARRRDGATVTEIAYRWGFSTASHFAADYRAAYGRAPSQALGS